jgi:hypothetical protein
LWRRNVIRRRTDFSFSPIGFGTYRGFFSLFDIQRDESKILSVDKGKSP